MRLATTRKKLISREARDLLMIKKAATSQKSVEIVDTSAKTLGLHVILDRESFRIEVPIN